MKLVNKVGDFVQSLYEIAPILYLLMDTVYTIMFVRTASLIVQFYDLGHSRGYINNISSGKTLPSMTEFFAICDYFGITPVEFFNEELVNPTLMSQTLESLSKLSEEDLQLTLLNIKRLLK